jgi:hypothetical protein
MLWILLVYVVASNGYAGQPVISPSFHGATFATKDECATAAKTVAIYPALGESDDIGKTGLVTVCAPVLPAPVTPPPQASTDPAQAQDPFPAYSPATPPKRK